MALTGELDLDAALRRIVLTCRSDLHRYRAVVLASRQPEGIHQTRVALRRLRAAIGLFRDVVDDPKLRGIASEAGWLADECGPARDLHVFLTDVIPEAPRRISRVGTRLAAARLTRARRALGGNRFAQFDRNVERFILSPSSSGGEPLKDFAARALDAHHAKVRRRGRNLSRLEAADLHRLRIAVKKLRYAATFLLPVFEPTATTTYVDATESLQNALGIMNDRTVGAKVLADISKASRPSDRARRPCKRLGKHLKDSGRHDRRNLKQAWRAFKKAGPFWRGAS
ncbi:MAG: CHAD domain-containing protein [Reyranella sp.]|uniref:CHAD domain-containing protein n=1 Tax=Reyranella sp. TaxID=1929291 RepID=UPI002730DE54|nr:CHAD domain-containing protein [Reyranella sp.]MDP1965971.1 CHAD domain-containing protein [Reyranella sp.]MDP2374345.1 CHAD domain-containing protein [Reyranella sp.]